MSYDNACKYLAEQYPAEFVNSTIHRYRVIRLWEQESATFLDIPALLPLATLTETNSPQGLLAQVAEQVARIPDREQRQNISGCTEILAGLRFEKELIRRFLREDVMRGSVIYQDILQQGLQQGRQQEARSLVVLLIERRLGKIEPSLIARVCSLPIEQLEVLGVALFDFAGVADLEVWLRQHDGREAQIALILRQLTRRLGEVEPSLVERIQGLSFEQLESLGEALLDFSEQANLVAWLEQQDR